MEQARVSPRPKAAVAPVASPEPAPEPEPEPAPEPEPVKAYTVAVEPSAKKKRGCCGGGGAVGNVFKISFTETITLGDEEVSCEEFSHERTAAELEELCQA